MLVQEFTGGEAMAIARRKAKKKASKKNELMSLLHNTVRSVTPSLYRGAMEAKFKEFFGRTRSKK